MFILLQLMLLFTAQAFAQECPEPKEVNDILTCLKDHHVLVQLNLQEVRETENLDKIMGKIPNPVLGIQSVHNRNDARQTQVTLTQEIDLSGKRQALRKQGQITHRLVQKGLDMTKEDVVEMVLLHLHHYFHLDETLKVDYEVKSSLERVIAGLNKRPVLNPEQEASRLNFKIQLGEVRNRIALLEDEQEEVLVFFEINGGYKKEQLTRVMESHFHSMEIHQDSTSESLKLGQLMLESKLAEQELKYQKGLVWDGISIGPMYMDDKMEAISEKLYGFELIMPIPLWQTNQAARGQATVKLENAKSRYNLFKKKEDLEKESLLDRVNNLKKHLSELPSPKELSTAHQRTENLYARGLITPYTFLDSHRVWREVTSSRLELEEKILNLSIAYYRRIGKLSEVKL